MASLASVANNQTFGLTSRRVKAPYNLAVISQLPAAREAEANRLANYYRTEALNQEKEQHGRSLAQSTEQFNQSLAQQKQIADIQAEQAEKASMISGGTSLATIGALTKDVWLPTVKSALGSGSASTAASAAAGAGYAAGTEAAVGLGTSAGTGAGVALGAEGAASAGYAAGAEAAAGVEAGTAAAGATSYLGPVAAAYAAPKLIDAIHEDSMKNLGKNLTFGLVDHGKTASTVGGAATGAAIGTAIAPGVGTVIGAVVGGISGSGSSWLCTAADSTVGLAVRDKIPLGRLRAYALSNPETAGWMQMYLDEGPKLVMAIRKGHDPEGLRAFYAGLKGTLIDPVIEFVRNGEMEAAYRLYHDVAEELFKRYAPQVERKEHEPVEKEVAEALN